MIHVERLNIAIINTLENSMPLRLEFSENTTPVLQYNGGDARHQYMMPSELTFTMEVSDATDLFFKHLFTGNESQYRVELTDQDDNLLWRGYLLPEQYSEPYEHAVLYVSFTATDGLARLKEKYLDDAYYNGTHSVINVIYNCLLQTNLTQEIYFAPAIENDFPGIAGDWDKICINMQSFKGNDRNDNCYNILEQLLETLACSLVSYEGIWYIIGHNRTITSDARPVSMLFYTYGTDGTPGDQVITSRIPNQCYFESTPEITLLPPLQRVTATWPINERENPFPEDLIQQPYELDGRGTQPPAVRYWLAVGGGMEMARDALAPRRVRTGYADYRRGNGSPLSPDEIQRRQQIVTRVEYVALRYSNAVITNNANFYMQLETPVYLKSEPDFIDVYLEIVCVLREGFPISTFNTLFNAGSYGNNIIHYAFLMNGVPFISNLPGYTNRDGYLLQFTKEGENTNTDPLRIVGKLRLENMQLPEPGGLLQVRLHAVVNSLIDFGIFIVGFRKLDVRYSARDEVVDDVTRDIDWTTVQEIDVSHGGTLNDLSEVSFTLINNNTSPAYVEQPVIGVQMLPFTFVPPIISHQYVEVTQAVWDALQVALSIGYSLYGIKYNETTYTRFRDTNFPVGFNQFRATGTGVNMRYFVYLQYEDVSLFNSFLLFGTPVQDRLFIYESTGDLTVPRAFREQWSRAGAPVVPEGRQFNACRAQLVHDTQPAALVKIDATIFGLWSPIEYMRYNLDGFKNFLPVNLSLALDQGMTQVTLVELNHDNDVETSFNE